MMAKVDQFLDQLINYDKENIHPDIIKNITPYLEDNEFNPDFIRSKSVAAAGIATRIVISTVITILIIIYFLILVLFLYFIFYFHLFIHF